MTHFSTHLAEISWNHQQDLATRYILAQEAARTTPTTTSTDAIIARMDNIEADGTYDLDADGLRRSRQGMVGDDMMTCQVAAHGADPSSRSRASQTATSAASWWTAWAAHGWTPSGARQSGRPQNMTRPFRASWPREQIRRKDRWQ